MESTIEKEREVAKRSGADPPDAAYKVSLYSTLFKGPVKLVKSIVCTLMEDPYNNILPLKPSQGHEKPKFEILLHLTRLSL